MIEESRPELMLTDSSCDDDVLILCCFGKLLNGLLRNNDILCVFYLRVSIAHGVLFLPLLQLFFPIRKVNRNIRRVNFGKKRP